MRISEQFETLYGGKIQFGLFPGGHSSWGQDEESVRLAWFNEDGKFSPHAAAELPFWGLAKLALESAQRDRIPRKYLGSLIAALATALQRSPFHVICTDYLRSKGGTLVCRLQAGSLVGSPMTNGADIVCPITVDETVSDYNQDDFEDDLRRLCDVLQGLMKLGTQGRLTLVFQAGGHLRLPEWFREFCAREGIEIFLVETDKDLERETIEEQLSRVFFE